MDKWCYIMLSEMDKWCHTMLSEMDKWCYIMLSEMDKWCYIMLSEMDKWCYTPSEMDKWCYTPSEMDKWCYTLSERPVGIQLALWLVQNEKSKKQLKRSLSWQCPPRCVAAKWQEMLSRMGYLLALASFLLSALQSMTMDSKTASLHTKSMYTHCVCVFAKNQWLCWS